MVSRAAKELLRNTIRNTDYHNRLLEEEEMWRHWETEKGLTMMVTDDYLRRRMRMDEYAKPAPSAGQSSVTRGGGGGGNGGGARGVGRGKGRGSGGGSHKCDVRELQKQKQAARVSQKGQSNFWMRKLMETEEKDPDRWGHSGYKELYPEEFKSSNSKNERSSSSPSEGLRSSRRSKVVARSNNQKSNKSSNQQPRWDHGGYRELYPDDSKSRKRVTTDRRSESPQSRHRASVDRRSRSGTPDSSRSRSPSPKAKKKHKRRSHKKSKKHKKRKKKSVPIITISDSSSRDHSISTHSSDDSNSSFTTNGRHRSRRSHTPRDYHHRRHRAPSPQQPAPRRDRGRVAERRPATTSRSSSASSRASSSLPSTRSSSRQPTSRSGSPTTSHSSSLSPVTSRPLSTSSSSSPMLSSHSLGSEVSYNTSKSSGEWIESDTSETLLETRREYLKRKLEEVAATGTPSTAESGNSRESSEEHPADRNGCMAPTASVEPVAKKVKLVRQPVAVTVRRKLKSQVVIDGAVAAATTNKRSATTARR